jgi:hypothetical protein
MKPTTTGKTAMNTQANTPALAPTPDASVSAAAAAAGYTSEEVKAGLEFAARKARRADPPGSFDNGGRFFAKERTRPVLTCRAPSRSFPYPELLAARTAAHCAEVFGAESLLAVRRVAKARDLLDTIPAGIPTTAHALAQERSAITARAVALLRPVKR